MAPKHVAALRWLASQPSGANAFTLPDEHRAAMMPLEAHRIGRKKIVSRRVGRGSFIEWAITDTGRKLLAALSE